MITIDGSIGEGGGQILRSSLALSLVTGKPFRIKNIRAGRKNPGLLRQHLTALRAAVEVGCAVVSGDSIGSMQVSFEPGSAHAGEYRFAVGTAGSTTLVLQTILPALMIAGSESSLDLEGGTHNPHAPPYDFLQKAFLPGMRRMGVEIHTELEWYGFYPAGGGTMQIRIRPASGLTPIEVLERGPFIKGKARALVANLPKHIAEREVAVLRKKLSWPADCFVVEKIANSHGPGNVVMIEVESQNVTEVFTAFGERRVPAEAVAEKAADAALRYLNSGIAVGPYLADQLLLPFAMAGSGAFTTLTLSSHSTTNIQVIRKFLDVDVVVEPLENRACTVRIRKS